MMYKKHEEKFKDVVANLETLESKDDIHKDKAYELEKREAEHAILLKADLFIRI